MDSIKRIFLNRGTILALIVSVLAAVLLGALVPQSFISEPNELELWRAAHPLLARWAPTLGLHHIYTTPAFAALLLASTLSLSLSTFQQCRLAWKRTFSVPSAVQGIALSSPLSPEAAVDRLRRFGFFPVVRGRRAKLVRQPWGYWGNALLHLGMVVTIAASCFISLTEQRGMLELAEGQSHLPSDRWLGSERGILVDNLVLKEPVRMEKVAPRFRGGQSLQQLVSTIAFLPSGGAPETQTVELNTILHRDGVRIYQGARYGHAFYVEVTDSGGRKEVYQFLMDHPARPDQAGYHDFPGIPEEGTVLRAKYYPDAARRSFGTDDPLLVLRAELQGRELGQVPLKVGGEGSIGGYRFRLVASSGWSQLIFVKLNGISVVFFGFSLLLLGGALHYFTPPREIVVEETQDGCRLTWSAVRFADFYADEPARLAQSLASEPTHG